MPLVFGLAREERDWYVWLIRELLNAVVLAKNKATLAAIVVELDELVHELLGRIPPR